MDAFAARQLRFDRFTIDPVRRTLRSGRNELELRPKSFDVLSYLVEHAGRLATKDEIIQTVWPNVIATDDSLARCISDIRHVLNDSSQQIIKTVPGRGYVFTVDISAVPENPRSSVATNIPASRRQMRPIHLVAALALLTLAVGAAFWGLSRPSTDLALPDRPSIAVLPFVNLSGDPGQDYLSDGLAQELSSSLSKVGQLFVIADQSAARYKGRSVEAAEIGRELGVRYLLQGSVRRDAEVCAFARSSSRPRAAGSYGASTTIQNRTGCS